MREAKSTRYVFAKFQNNLNTDIIDKAGALGVENASQSASQSAQTRTIPT